MQATQFEFSTTSTDSALNIVLLDKKSFKKHSNKDTLAQLGFEGNFKQTLLIPSENTLLVGCEFKEKVMTSDPYYQLNSYELGATAYHALASTKVSEVLLSSVPASFHNADFVSDFVLGFLQGSLKITTFTKPPKKDTKRTLSLSPEVADTLSGGYIHIINALNSGINLNRQLVDATPFELNPDTVVDILEQVFVDQDNLEKNYYSYNQLLEIGAEGITAVGRASEHKPVLVHYILKPSKKVKRKIALVGKGLTYDSGGLDIKISGHMKTMKCDMGGAGLMVGVFKTLSHLDLEHTEVHWITAFAENMVGGDAYKPDDILTTLSGQTVEVVNTDAEGRLTLSDALTFATMENPDYIIDAATLTGACIFALTDHYTALMGNDDEFARSLLSSFETNQERAQYVAMPEILRETLKGDLSDLKNLPDAKGAGHVTAGLYLSHFINQNNFRNEALDLDEKKEYRWVHLDIAGTSYNKKHNELGYNGATGHGVRSLTHWILTNDNS